MRLAFSVLLSLLLPTIATAAPLVVQVRTPQGAPVAGAVVTVHLAGRATPAPRGASVRTISQQNLQFHPFLLVVPVGASVTFPNLDPVRHHVYSFSPAKTFELKLYAREQNRAVTFERPGIVAIGCNIHDQMTAFIDVVDTPWAVSTDAQGNATFGDLPDSQVAIAVWHPYLRAPGNQLVRVAASGGRQGFVATLRTPPKPMGGGY